jgi:uncharacterized cofD-like protein
MGIFLIIAGFSLLWGKQVVVFTLSLFDQDPRLLSSSGFLSILLGAAMLVIGARSALRSILEIVVPEQENALIDVLFEKRLLKSGPRIVVIGGGTGLSVLLRGLKQYTSNITAVVTVSDDGGSSGKLRGDMGILPPGDIRNCVLALADTEPLLEKLFQYRFREGELQGHSFGNLLIAAMTSITGDFQKAIKEFSKVLAVRGRVLPVTTTNVSIRAELESGEVVEGESILASHLGPVKKVMLQPSDALALPEVLQAIMDADAVVLGPGSLFTSVIPNLLVGGVSDALKQSPAAKIYICNVMTQRGETTGFSASQHVAALQNHARGRIIDYVLVNTGRIRPNLVARYREEGAAPVSVDMSRLNQLAVHVMTDDVLQQGETVRHDPDKLARRVMRLVIKSTLSTERRRREKKRLG